MAVDFNKFTNQADDLVTTLYDLVNTLPHKGDTEEQSQKVVLKKRIKEVEKALNGLKKEDFIKESKSVSKTRVSRFENFIKTG